ncbi:hypothetical protein [Phenylobacterium montanum]|uniref:Uncharacterized protein n=1 Tax=Phenylobacterium montanum TaxID=2823693 RepID=A0A975G395_9CAUL|nr:hypothetical protein [Caulobacter sp. S6]QUD89767.1 hypothetical protein KCG34_07820 [Caulobacter sp. S6]
MTRLSNADAAAQISRRLSSSGGEAPQLSKHSEKTSNCRAIYLARFQASTHHTVYRFEVISRNYSIVALSILMLAMYISKPIQLHALDRIIDPPEWPPLWRIERHRQSLETL